MQKSLIGLVGTLALCTNLSYAETIVYGRNGADCTQITGKWSGSGKASNWLVDCSYHGDGVISAVDEAGKFTIDLAVDKDSGSFLCPGHVDKHYPGTCVNGIATINSEYGDLVGDFLQDSGSIKGKIKVAPAVSAELMINFSRAK